MIEIEDTSIVGDVIAAMEDLNSLEVQVGVQGEEGSFMVMLATVHEFGTEIEVTDKMRKYLGAKGLHLRKDTRHIIIPERSYLRSTFDENEELFEVLCTQVAEGVLSGNKDAKLLMEDLGGRAAKLVRMKMIDLDNPKKHPFTLQQAPGKDNPLIQEGHLLKSISSEVKKK